MKKTEPVHVAVGVIRNEDDQFFIARRPQHVHQGGLWEFPGGKVEENETVVEALQRELHEEIGIDVELARPLIRIPYSYPDKSVLLDVWRVEKFTGHAHGREQQEINWVSLDELSSYPFPAANQPIIRSLMLPDSYLVTGEFSELDELLSRTRLALQSGVRLVQFRAHHLDSENYFYFAKELYALCEKFSARLLLNTKPENFHKHGAENFSHGIHLNHFQLEKYHAANSIDGMVAASVHNKSELKLAEEKKIDFVVLSPVKQTTSHPDEHPLGWQHFTELCDITPLPVYALGGMQADDIPIAQSHGAQGIAAIGAFWNNLSQEKQ